MFSVVSLYSCGDGKTVYFEFFEVDKNRGRLKSLVIINAI